MLNVIKEYVIWILNRRELRKNRVNYDKINISGRILIRNQGKIEIGNNVNINSGKGRNPIGGDVICRLINKGGNIIIGNNVGISNSTIVSINNITIEDNVLIGGGCKIYDNDFHPIDYNDRINNKNTIKSKPIIIKEGAFIGAHTIILKGAVIGRHSIIGAGSVVTGNVPDGEIWAGNPCRFCRKIEGNIE